MSILNKEEFFKSLAEFIGDNRSDEAIAFMENMADTYTDLESRASGDGIDWKKKYEENDAAWKERIYNRFMGGNTGESKPINEYREIKEVDFDDIFEEVN